MMHEMTVPGVAARSNDCEYCGVNKSTGSHADDCPQRPHVFDGDPRDVNDFCGVCSHLFPDADHIVAGTSGETGDEYAAGNSDTIGRPPEEDDDEDGVYSTTVDGQEARVISLASVPVFVSVDVRLAIEKLEEAKQKYGDAAERAKDAGAEKKAAQDRLNEAVDAAIEAMHADTQPGLFS